MQQHSQAQRYSSYLSPGQHRAQLCQALYMPSFPQGIFLVSRVTNGGATIIFKEDTCHMTIKDGCRFDIYESGNLYYLLTVEQNMDECKVCHDIQTWHEIMGHCNYEDIQKLQGVVKGMEIKRLRYVKYVCKANSHRVEIENQTEKL